LENTSNSSSSITDYDDIEEKRRIEEDFYDCFPS
jgi:hypothetical protein